VLTPPGIDRHTHLEGSLDPAWVRSEAARRGLAVPASLLRLWNGETLPFEGFIEAFLFGAGFLDGPGAVRAAVNAAVGRLPATEAPRGIDLWVSPHFLVVHQGLLSLDALWRGLEAGLEDAKAAGVAVAVVVDAVNHFGPLHGHATLNLVLPDRPGWLVGFSTGGLEGVPFREWAPVFERARAAGLRIAAHAGENGPGSNVREALLEGGVGRIVHGIRAAGDPGTLDLLAERRIPVDICLSSNGCLVPGVSPHPLPALLRAGVRCALGTDDPGVMPCDLASEWNRAGGLGLDSAELQRLKEFAAADAWCLG
jgi:aminodeoxyfutalosine deaminase